MNAGIQLIDSFGAVVQRKFMAALAIGLTMAVVPARAGTTDESLSSITLAPPSIQPLSLTAADMSSVKSLSEEDLTNFVGVLSVTPTIAYTSLPRNKFGTVIGGTYYSLQHLGDWPPMPCNSAGCAVWQLSDCFLINDINVNYDTLGATSTPFHSALMMTADDSTPPPIPGGDGGTNGYKPNGGPMTFVAYGTNLFIYGSAVVGGYLTANASNTIADISYEILSRTNLVQTDWYSEGFFPGSELTNWTPFSVSQGQRTNLFIRLRSWQDTFDIGIPDWWQLYYFGTNGIDPDASAAGDGFSNIQKFDMGLNPTNYFNPNGPPGFFGYLDATGTNVFIAWSQAPGPVVNYSVQRGIFNSLSGLYGYSQLGTVSSNANFIEDVGAINNSNATNNIYQLEAVYPGGSLSATDTWQVVWFSQYGTVGAPYGPPAPTNFYAYADTNATNVLLSWMPASSVATNYLIERGIFNTTSNAYVYRQIGSVSPATNSFKVTGPFTNANNWSDHYAIVAVYPGGVQAPMAVSPVNVGWTNGLAGPASFYGYADGTGTNLVLAWTPAAGAPTNYDVFGGNANSYGAYAYHKLAIVNGTTSSLVVTNGFSSLYDGYAIFAVYTNGSMSQSTVWQSANGAPTPGDFVAYFDATGTNIWLSWSAPTGAITGYQVVRFDQDSEYFVYNVNSNTTSFEDRNAVHYGDFDPLGTIYTIQAFYAHGGASPTAWASVGSLPTPTGVSAALDTNGQNVVVTWYSVAGATGYVIDRGVMNPTTGSYSYSQIATVGSAVTSYVDIGAIAGANSFNNHYRVMALFPGNVYSDFVDSSISDSSAIPTANINITANLIRNGAGKWQMMFSGLPTNSAQVVQINFSWGLGYLGEVIGNIFSTNLCTTNILGSVYPIPDAVALTLTATNQILTASAQLFGPNGEPGQICLAGYLANDAPYFVDGRKHMKQNLSFLLSAASKNRTFANSMSVDWLSDGSRFYVGGTNFEEFSFFHQGDGNGDSDPTTDNYTPYLEYFQLDDLWPFEANYDLANYILDTSRTNDPYGTTNFIFQPNVAVSVPAQAILGQPGSESILQPALSAYLQNQQTGLSPANWGLNINAQLTSASLNASVNLYGITYSGGYIISATNQYAYQAIGLNGGVTTPAGYLINGYGSSCANPSLSLASYYFAPVLPAVSGFTDIGGLYLPGQFDAQDGYTNQPYPLPIEPSFSITNTSQPLIASVGQPMIIGSWAKYAVGSSGKFGYLGQYFATNAFLLNSNGVVTTNNAGIMSPYGEFFPMQAGAAQVMTLPDVDPPYQQGTNVVRIISMNVDANHDGTMDLSYGGADFVSASKPFRFWINDNQDSGDFGGDGVPGKGDWGDANMYTSHYDYDGRVLYYVHGTRDLVDFFPVYLNIGALTKALPSSGSIKYILKQKNTALRFLYTDLTPTNYMNFLQDTNEAERLATNYTMVIPPDGYILDSAFVNSLATNNQGILLLEGSQDTTNPLVLEVWQGSSLNNGDSPYLFTPQKMLGQTTLPLSLTGVEQMFRSKTMMLNPEPGTVPDRLTDASVPNEPDTIDKNFVFVHGYNVNPQQARGWDADFYKRMYWSGSHAKFYGITWEAADTQVAGQVTINLQTNIVNAFNTAPVLNDFLNSLGGTTIVAAHSLGNMLVLSTLNDYNNRSINAYFMIDAAVPMEAMEGYQGQTGPMLAGMIHSEWIPYANKLYASNWRLLFPTNDARSALTWSNRLANVQNADVYNFYSSGEEVLRPTSSDPPTNLLSAAQTIVANYIFSHTPVASFMWVWQEKGKGRCASDGLLSSSHGGWKFNSAYDTNGAHMSTSQASLLSNLQLSTNAFFDVTSPSFGTADTALFGSGGNSYAHAHLNRILSDAIPSLTLPVGANAVTNLDIEFGGKRNFDMTTELENSWPAGLLESNEGNHWHHSDCRQVAYIFTRPLFDNFVTLGKLK